MEILCGGFGGQGIIKMGYIIGQAAAIYEGKNAVQTQSYGPEARGGACTTGIIIAKEEIDYPKVRKPDFFIVMSQPAFDVFAETLKPEAGIIYDPDLVKISEKKKSWQLYPVPAVKIAEKLGKQMIANMVMLGAFVKVSKAVKKESLKCAIMQAFPPKTHQRNLQAFTEGMNSVKETD